MNDKLRSLKGPLVVGPLIFGPGIFFAALGLAVLLAPKFVIAVLSGFLLFVGIAFCYIAWKFIQLKQRFENQFKDLHGSIQIQAYRVDQPFDFEEPPTRESGRKIIVH